MSERKESERKRSRMPAPEIGGGGWEGNEG